MGRFDPEIVRRAIVVNNPHRIVLNHMDYVDPATRDGRLTSKGETFLAFVEAEIGRQVALIGTGPDGLLARPLTRLRHAG